MTESRSSIFSQRVPVNTLKAIEFWYSVVLKMLGVNSEIERVSILIFNVNYRHMPDGFDGIEL